MSGPRKPWRRALALVFACVDRIMDKILVGRLLQERNLAALEMTRREIRLGKGGNGIGGLKIAFLSDIHAGCSLGEKELVRVFEMVGEEEPDMVLLGGDLINTREKEIFLYDRALAKISPEYGVFAVPGNHDYFYGRNLAVWKPFLEERGVKVLINEAVEVKVDGSSLWIAGVDDLTEGVPDLPRTLATVPVEEPVVLLSHHPDFFFEAAAAYVDLTLSGHTHGGQISICRKFLGHSRFGYWAGLFSEEESFLYVSRGIGTTLLPFRLGVRPEIPLFRISRPSGA